MEQDCSIYSFGASPRDGEITVNVVLLIRRTFQAEMDAIGIKLASPNPWDETIANLPRIILIPGQFANQGPVFQDSPENVDNRGHPSWHEGPKRPEGDGRSQELDDHGGITGMPDRAIRPT